MRKFDFPWPASSQAGCSVTSSYGPAAWMQTPRRKRARYFSSAAARELVPPHPTLGDVDSAQALHDYQAAKRAHKAEWMRMKAGTAG